MMEVIEKANFRLKRAGENLIIAIVQDYLSKEVLMVAYMNREALERTLDTGKMHYYSTSRRKLWFKGETSGHHQLVKEVRIDCDGDALVFFVEQRGSACHEGYDSCFFRRLENGKLMVFKEKKFDPEKVYK